MKRTITTMVALVWVSAVAFGEPTAYWQFDDAPSGAAVKGLASETNAAKLGGTPGVFSKGTPPVFDAAVPSTKIWNGGDFLEANPENRASLRIANEGVPGSLAPFGGEVTVSGTDAKTHMADFTVEAFVKINQQMPHHALIASKRRNGQTGATWSLSIDPGGRVRARFDTQPDTDAASGTGFNQSIGSSASLNDGEWHHVALTFESATRAVAIYVDYERCGRGVTSGPLVYDESVLVFGRGLDGWLDEVRITPAALHPEQFLRTTQYFSELKPQSPHPTFLDQTYTRVQSALSPELKRIGTLIPKSVDEIDTPMWSLGCETLDRNLANWNAYKGYLKPLGIKRIRLQGGWNRTEKKKGEYDFSWLDHIVDDAIELGLEVCLETSYNNRLYEPRGATGPGGKLPSGEETLAAWDRWVEAMACRYSAKGVNEWMMYNEPNLNKGNTIDDIVENNIRTAEIIKRIDPDAKIGAFVLSGLSVKRLESLLSGVNERGKAHLFEWAIYHGYAGNPDLVNRAMVELQAMLKRVAPNIRAWQGEAGCASEEVQFALSGIPWTEYSHAKWNARRMLCDFGHDVDSSVFTISDLAYHKDFISRYGLLKTNPDNSIIKVKTAYYTVQNVVSVFNDAVARVPDYKLTIAGTEKELTWFAFRDKKTGLDVVTLWNGTEIPSDDSDIELVDVSTQDGHFESPVWIDIITGNVYELPAEQVTRQGDTVLFKDVPVYDGPGVLTDRSLLTFEPARERKKKTKPAPKKPAPAKKEPASGGPKLKTFLLPGTQQPAPAVLIVGPVDQAAIDMAKWLNEEDVHAFVVETDENARAALDHLRSRAAPWQLKTDALGVMALGRKHAAAVLAAGAHADFTVLIATEDGETFPDLSGAKPKAIFLGKKDAWKESLSTWLEKRKGKVF